MVGDTIDADTMRIDTMGATMGTDILGMVLGMVLGTVMDTDILGTAMATGILGMGMGTVTDHGRSLALILVVEGTNENEEDRQDKYSASIPTFSHHEKISIKTL